MQLKAQPEDFMVREHALVTMGSGPYSLYLLRKRLRNTEDVLQEITRVLRVQRKDIGYCGNKDKQAITEQYITIRNGPPIARITDTFTITFLGNTAEPLRLGVHERNFFTITVRDVTKKPSLAPIKNYYGEQRFSVDNVEIGLALLQKKYKHAADLLKLEYTTDPIGALRKIPRHTLLLYAHAVQSKLWNELAENLPATQQDVPLAGFGIDNTPYKELLEKYSLTEDMFVNRSLPELFLEGSARPLLQDVRDFSASDVHDGVCVVSFSLGKSSYATETVKQLFS